MYEDHGPYMYGEKEKKADMCYMSWQYEDYGELCIKVKCIFF
jgi:hypothetical protein